jgi:ABC-type uncharacterized transport system permease subunit
MTAVIWFAAGVLVGVNVGLLHAWLSLRRANRKAIDGLLIRLHNTPTLVFDHTKKRRRLW